MERSYKLIAEVNTQTKNWTVIAQVYDRIGTQTSNYRGYDIKCQRIHLIDAEGDTIVALLYDRAILHFQDRFSPGRRYRISNAQVRPSNANYSSKPDELCLTINNSTPVQEVQEIHPPFLPPLYNFSAYASLHRNVDMEHVTQNVLGIVIHALESEDITTSMGLTMTQDFIIINQEAIENEAIISEVLEKQAYRMPQILFPLPSSNDIVPIASVLAPGSKKLNWICSEPKLLDITQKMFYTYCPNCNKAITSSPGYLMLCYICKKVVEIVPRFVINIADDTSNMDATIFGEDVDYVMPFDVHHFYSKQKSGKLDFEEIKKFIENDCIAIPFFPNQYQKIHNAVTLHLYNEQFATAEATSCSTMIASASTLVASTTYDLPIREEIQQAKEDEQMKTDSMVSTELSTPSKAMAAKLQLHSPTSVAPPQVQSSSSSDKEVNTPNKKLKLE